MRKSLLLIPLLAMAALTSGCAGIGKNFENNVYCKVGEPSAVAVSQWGMIGISSTLANGDKICPAPVASTAQAIQTK